MEFALKCILDLDFHWTSSQALALLGMHIYLCLFSSSRCFENIHIQKAQMVYTPVLMTKWKHTEDCIKMSDTQELWPCF